MGEESNPPVFDTEPKEVHQTTDLLNIQIETLRDELVNSIEAVEPRITVLSENVESVIKNLEKKERSIGSEIFDEVNLMQLRKEQIYNFSINTARRIQSLGLKQQTAQTLLIPKQFRPTHDCFFNFKDEFDTSLKNVASLSRNVTQNCEKAEFSLKSINNIPKELDISKQKIEYELRRTKENFQSISHMKAELYQRILESQQKVVDNFNQKIGLLEAFLDEQEEKSSIKSSKSIKDSLNSQSNSIKTSFNGLMGEISKATERKLGDVEKQIEGLNQKSNKEIKALKIEIENEINEINSAQMNKGSLSESDEIEKEKENSELEILIERFESLKEKIKNGQNKVNKEGYEDHKGKWEGKEVVFRCFNNGFFTVIEEED